MNNTGLFALLMPLFLLGAGCKTTLDEVRSKWKFGPEFRSAKNQSLTRWTTQTGLEGKWSNGWTTGVTYRGRYNGDFEGYDIQDQGVWFEFGFPIWKRPQEDQLAVLAERVSQLEKRLAEEQLR